MFHESSCIFQIYKPKIMYSYEKTGRKHSQQQNYHLKAKSADDEHE